MKRSMMIVLSTALVILFTYDVFSGEKPGNQRQRNNQGNQQQTVPKKKKVSVGLKGTRAFTKIPYLNGDLFAPIIKPMMNTASTAMISAAQDMNGSEFGPRWGWVLGPSLKYVVSDGLEIQVDVLYSQKGAKSTDPPIEVNIDYIEVPVLLKFRLKPSGLRVLVGPYFAFRVTPQNKIVKVEGELTAPFKELKKYDWGLTLGVSFPFPPIPGIIIEPRYSWGQREIFQGGHATTSAISIMLGYDFIR
jgi:hypothetical protein